MQTEAFPLASWPCDCHSGHCHPPHGQQRPGEAGLLPRAAGRPHRASTRVYLCQRTRAPAGLSGDSGSVSNSTASCCSLLAPRSCLRSPRGPGVQASPSLVPPRGTVAREQRTAPERASSLQTRLPWRPVAPGLPGSRLSAWTLGAAGGPGRQWSAGSLQHFARWSGQGIPVCALPGQSEAALS